jgi:DNA-binding transcriptional regulator YhcF (GntR family)
MKKKYLQIASLIENRIEQGNYTNGILPGLRILGNELDVSYLTVRQALHVLCEKGILKAENNRNFKVVNSFAEKVDLKIATISPLGSNNDLFNKVIKTLLRNYNISLKQFLYAYKEDEIIPNAVDGNFDLIFFLIEPDNFSPLVKNKFKNNKNKLVSVLFDYRDIGIRTVAEADIEKSIEMLFKLISERNHKKIDILATTHKNQIIDKRIEYGQKFAGKYNLKCNVHRKKVPDFYYEMEYSGMLTSDIYTCSNAPDAIFVPTVPAAMAVQRKLMDIGLTSGRDYSLISCEDYHFAVNCIPSITVSYSSDTTPYLKELIDNHNVGYFDKLLYKPMQPEIFIGESLI